MSQLVARTMEDMEWPVKMSSKMKQSRREVINFRFFDVSLSFNSDRYPGISDAEVEL